MALSVQRHTGSYFNAAVFGDNVNDRVFSLIGWTFADFVRHDILLLEDEIVERRDIPVICYGGSPYNAEEHQGIIAARGRFDKEDAFYFLYYFVAVIFVTVPVDENTFKSPACNFFDHIRCRF